MTLKEELELLRGEPIKLRTPVEQVPCNETSDAERLCRNPIVSVYMVTYNHDPYIAQAIEGVMMQQTDFEFELVIGEDASQDRTRKICFEYQKWYPDKIRVLWSEENVTRPYGGNGPRVMARCRGEFIAFCEGDDYWTDPLKLQKQVDAMLANPQCTLCFSDAKIMDARINEMLPWPGHSAFREGVQDRVAFFDIYIRERVPWIMTATLMVRRKTVSALRRHEPIFSWWLRIGDMTLILGAAMRGDIYYLKRQTSVYRRGVGISIRDSRVNVDAKCVRYYYAKRVWGVVPGAFIYDIFWMRYRRLPWLPWRVLCAECHALRQVPFFAPWVRKARFRWFATLLCLFPFAAFLVRCVLHVRRKMVGLGQ